MDYYTEQMMSLRHKIHIYSTLSSLGKKKKKGKGEHTVFSTCITAKFITLSN